MGILDKAMQAYIDVNGVDTPEMVRDAYSQLQKTMSSEENPVQKFSTQAENGGLDLSETGGYYGEQKGESRSPLERWKRQVDGMIKSGNKTLMKEGLSQLSQYRSRDTSPAVASDGRTTAQKEHAQAVRNGTFTGSLGDWKKEFMPSQFAPEIVKHGDKYENPTTGEIVTPIAGTPLSEIYKQGLVAHTKTTGADAGKQAQMENAIAQLPYIAENIYSPDGSFDEDVMNAAFYIGHDPSWGAVLSKKGMKYLGGYSDETLSRANKVSTAMENGLQAITRTETGAAMPMEEIANTRKRFQPGPTDDPGVKAQKMKAYMDFLQNARKLMSGKTYGDDVSRYAKDLNAAADESLRKASEKAKVDRRPAAGMKVGQVEEGQTYLGGDPSLESSWSQ